MSLLNFLNQKEHNCTSTPVLTINLPESLEQEAIEIEKEAKELETLLKSIIERKKVFEAKKTLFWDQVHTQWPEVKNYRKNRITDDNRQILVFDCESCPNHKSSDIGSILGGLFES